MAHNLVRTETEDLQALERSDAREGDVRLTAGEDSVEVDLNAVEG